MSVKTDLREMLEELSTPNFLIVDDDKDELMLISRMVKELPMKVTGVNSVHDAVIVLEREDFFAALIDLRMPQQSGADLIKWMHDTNCLARRIVLTGYFGGGLMDAALRYGPIIVMAKPFSLEWFRDLLYLLNLPHYRHAYAVA